MVVPHRIILTGLLVCALLIPAPELAHASKVRPIANSDQIVSKGQIAGVAIGIAAVGAAIGVGVYFAIRHNASITGCAASGLNGLQLVNEGDSQTYSLMGIVASIKPGDRVRVSGKKKKVAGVAHPFLVEKVKRDFGACAGQSATP
ncbi:MAG TPA: hypothetical protein VG267_19385 [Terracidiphilus sp.]|nr:hypothetical protein [Terracidiphilus sp.]